MNWNDIADAMFGGLPYYGEILALVSNSVWAGAVVGLVGGLVGVFVMQRDMAFAVHDEHADQAADETENDPGPHRVRHQREDLAVHGQTAEHGLLRFVPGHA